jgi:hypothetical protein
MPHQIISKIKELGAISVPDIDYGDVKLQVMPFNNNQKQVLLPMAFRAWQETFDEMRGKIPLFENCNTHYLSIESRFFFLRDSLRREGLHLDGNFCIDLDFMHETPGLVKVGWGSPEPVNNDLVSVEKFAIPYPDCELENGKYISNDFGGILTASRYRGCKAYEVDLEDVEVGSGGDLESQRSRMSSAVIFEEDKIMFMSSTTPHESLQINKGDRRAFLRITLNHKYPNKLIFN